MTTKQQAAWDAAIDALECAEKYGEGRVTKVIRKQALRLLREAGDGWESIETAPKDGTTVHAWIGSEPRKVAYLGDSHGRDPGWYMHGCNSWEKLYDRPVNWRPLPAPPKTP